MRAIYMRCDHPGCILDVKRAPRIVIPSRTPEAEGHKPLRIMTTLHYCDLHRMEGMAFNLRDYLTDYQKARVERVARVYRPESFQPDFDAAWMELLLTTTPEYRAFLHDIGARDAA